MSKITKKESDIADFAAAGRYPIRDPFIYRVARKGRGTIAYFESKEAAEEFIIEAEAEATAPVPGVYTSKRRLFDCELTEEMKRDFRSFWSFFDNLVEWYEDENHEKWEEIPDYNRMILHTYAATVWNQKRFVDRGDVPHAALAENKVLPSEESSGLDVDDSDEDTLFSFD